MRAGRIAARSAAADRPTPRGSATGSPGPRGIPAASSRGVNGGGTGVRGEDGAGGNPARTDGYWTERQFASSSSSFCTGRTVLCDAMERPVDQPRPLLEARARVPEHVVYHDFETETIVLNLETGEYHGLNATGGRILARVAAAADLREVAGALADEYGQARNEVEQDVNAFCRDLLARGLIEVVEPVAR